MTALLFDLDGTIADSVPVIIDTSIKTCADFGKRITEDDIKPLIGVPLIVQGETLLGEGMGEAYRRGYQERYFHLQENCIKAFPGISELLQELQGQASIAIVTSKGKEGTDFSLHCLRIGGCFDAVINAHSGCGFKPEAGPALAALRQMNELPQNAIFIGDSIFDLRCGKNAGTATCAVLWGAGREEELLAEQPDYTAKSCTELRELLLQFIAEHKDIEQ